MKKKQTIKEKLINILKSYKTIIYISFFINLVLLIFSYNLMTNNHKYTFNGRDDYISIKDGLIVLNNDLNILYGNNIQYVNEVDYEIKSLTLGYYVIDDDNNLKKVIDKFYSFDENMMLSDFINNFTNFNLTETTQNISMFTTDNVKSLNNGLYFILKAKTLDDKVIECQIDLNLTKISKF